MSELSGFGYEEYRQLCDKLSRANERVRMLEMDNDRLKAIVTKQKAQLWDFRGPEKIRADALEEAATVASDKLTSWKLANTAKAISDAIRALGCFPEVGE